VTARYLAVLCLALCASCRTPLPRAVEQTQELTTMEKSRVVALRAGDGLSLRFPIKGRDAYASVTLPDKGAGVPATMDFGSEARDKFAAARRAGRRLPVYGAEAWRRISRRVAAELAPASRNQCALVTTGGQELLACRNASGEAVFMSFTERPRGMKITRRIPRGQLTPRLLAAFTAAHGTGEALLLTGQSPPLLHFHPAASRIAFIFAPPEETLRVPVLGDSPDVTVRGVLSLGLRSGVLATLKNPVTTALHGSANLISMGDAALHGVFAAMPATPPPPVTNRPPMNIEAWENRLDRVTGEARVPASVRLRIDGDQFFPDFIHAVQEARESIDILIYIWDTDDYALQIADLVKAKSREGVRVRILMDDAASLHSSLGSSEFPNAPGHRAPSSIVEYLRRDSNVRVRPMAMPALTSTHSKMIMIDGRLGWIGGMNIGREYRSDWHDMMIELKGPILGWMQHSFEGSWKRHSWGGDFAEFLTLQRRSAKAAARIPVPPGAIMVRPLKGSAIHSDVKSSQFAALRAAQQRIWLENSYITDSRYIHELVKARHRGVDVRVIMPEENDSPVLKVANKALMGQLIGQGIRVWLLPEMSHVKAAIYDGWATVGSANYDRLSFRVNEEFNIGYSDPAAVETLRRDLFLRDMARGKEVTSVPERSPGRRITDALLQMLAKQM
jgi:cardiolipin synthase